MTILGLELHPAWAWHDLVNTPPWLIILAAVVTALAIVHASRAR